MNKFFIWRAKSDTWFEPGSICILITQTSPNAGLFIGISREGKIDEEICHFDEFKKIVVDTPDMTKWYYGKNTQDYNDQAIGKPDAD
jgi:hypothetical protein